MMSKNEKIISKINEWRDDWNKFAKDVLGATLDKEQQEIIEAVQNNSRVSVVSGTARGKDFVAACAAICFLYLTPRWNKSKELIQNTKVALTAPTDRQVKNIMMPEIFRLMNKARSKGVLLPGTLTSADIRTGNKEWFLTGFKADDNSPESWSGFHAVNTMFVITEASGISDGVFEAIEGNLQGNSRILLVFNPNSPVGYAAKSQKDSRWSKFRLNSLTAPNVIGHKIIIPGQVDYEWVVDKLNSWCTVIDKSEVQEEQDDFYFEGNYYRPEDLFRKKVLGKFPKVGDDTLIPLQWIELAQERWKKFDGQYAGEKWLGVDVAGMGRDSTVYCERVGNYAASFKKYHSGGKADHMRIAGDVINYINHNKDAFISIDTIGEGAGVYSRVNEVSNNPRVISCKYSEAAKAKDKELTDITGQYRFANLRAYLFWAVRDWLNPKNETGAMLPPDEEFAGEAAEILWSFRSDGKILIEPKEDIVKRIGRSTDKFDSLANTFYPVLMKKPINLARISKLTH
jgi:hypothetical protein